VAASGSGGVKTFDRIAWALLCAFVFTIPWEKSVLVPEFGTIARFLGWVAFAAGLVSALRLRPLRRPNGALLLAAVFVAWSGATWLWSVDAYATMRRVKTFAELAGMFWLIWNSCRTEERHRQLMQAYVFGAAAASSLAFWRYLHNRQTYYLRYAAEGFDPNDFGLVLAIAVPLALYLALKDRSARRWVYLAIVPMMLAAIVLTASRASLIATFVAFTFAFFAWRAADGTFRVVSLGLMLALGLSLFRFGPEPQRKRLATIRNEITQGTLHDRTRIWKAGLKALKQHPIIGAGSGAYPKAVEPWLGKSKVVGFQFVAHNTFLSVLVESGAIGFGIYALMWGTLLLYAWSMAPLERSLWIVVALSWAVGVFTLTWEQYKPTWLVISLITTAWANAWRDRRQP
jgi:O-antigen ligase